MQGYIDLARSEHVSLGARLSLSSGSFAARAESMKIGRQELSALIDDYGRATYVLPQSVAIYFHEIFNELDKNKAKYNIESYRVNGSSLEDIFLEIGRREDAKLEKESFLAERLAQD